MGCLIFLGGFGFLGPDPKVSYQKHVFYK